MAFLVFKSIQQAGTEYLLFAMPCTGGWKYNGEGTGTNQQIYYTLEVFNNIRESEESTGGKPLL